MSFASNMNAKVGFIAESTLGQTPATPTLVNQPFESFTLTPSTSELVDGRKTGSRELSAVIPGNTTYSGNLTGPLSFLNYDQWFSSALFNSWATGGVLKVGTTRKSFTAEVTQSDIAKFVQYRGILVNGFTIDSPSGSAFTTISFDLLAMAMTVANASIDTNAYTPVVMHDGFKSCGGVVKEGGNVIGNVQAINLTYTNNLSPLDVWGECEPGDFSEGQIDITGTLTLFYSDHNVVSKFISGAYSSLEFTLLDAAGQSMTFYLPRIKYSGSDMPVESGSGERLISLPFRAVKDVTEGTGIVITSTP